MIILTSEQQGCAYSIDSEGTLFYTPMCKDSSINLEEWDEVDHMAILGEEQSVQDDVNDILERLITVSKALGEYYCN